MLVVVGSRHDPDACAIVQRWERWGAVLLSCEDLSASGWRYSSSDRDGSRAVIGGQIVHDAEIRGVLVRRPCILQQELTHIAPEDREFLAAEMNAFLVAWLTRLSCCVLNRPRGTVLCGPGWRPQQWALAAARIGIQPAAARWDTSEEVELNPPGSSPPATPPRELVVVGDRCFGEAGEDEEAVARGLAAAAGVSLLGISLAPAGEEKRFIAATPMPSLSDPRVADAVCEHLLSSG